MPRREREREVPLHAAPKGLRGLFEEDPPGPHRGAAWVLHEPGAEEVSLALVHGLLAEGFSTLRIVPEPSARGFDALHHLRGREAGRDRAPRLIVGQGAVAPLALALAAERDGALAALSLLGAPAHWEHVEGVAGVSLPDPIASARRLRVPLLLLHDPEDQRVPAHDARVLFRAASHPKSFLAVPGAGDGFRRAGDVQWAMEMVARWAAAQVPNPSGTSCPHGRVRVSGRETLQNHVVAGRHELLADEPLDLGGFDTGPAPHEWVLGGLGACTSMTLRMYADRKGWPLRRVQVDLQIERRPHKEGSRTVVDSTIRRTIRLEGELDAVQRARLLEIAERCPVHRTLTGRIAIESRLASQAEEDDVHEASEGAT